MGTNATSEIVIGMTGIVYSITNTVNGKRYIGSCTDTAIRWKNHRSTLRRGKHHNCHLQASYNKHGHDAFEYEVLIVCDADARHAMEEMAFNVFRHSGLYNVKQVAVGGSRRGMNNSDEHKRKNREAALNQDWTEHKKAMSEWQAKRTPEMEAERRRKISEKMKLIRASAPVRGGRTETSPNISSEDTRPTTSVSD
jgi:group I intron endonuclease